MNDKTTGARTPHPLAPALPGHTRPAQAFRQQSPFMPLDPASAQRLAMMSRMYGAAPMVPSPMHAACDPNEMMRFLAQAQAAGALSLPAGYMHPAMLSMPSQASQAAVMEAMMQRQAAAAAAYQRLPLNWYPQVDASQQLHPFLRDPQAFVTYRQQKAAIAAAQHAAASKTPSPTPSSSSSFSSSSSSASPASASAPPKAPSPGPPTAAGEPLHLKLGMQAFKPQELARLRPQSTPPADSHSHACKPTPPSPSAAPSPPPPASSGDKPCSPPPSCMAPPAPVSQPCSRPPSSSTTPTPPSPTPCPPPPLPLPLNNGALSQLPHPHLSQLRLPPFAMGHCGGPLLPASLSPYPCAPPQLRNFSPVPVPLASPLPMGDEHAHPADPLTRDRRRERWTQEEHELFLKGLSEYGRKWVKIQSLLPHKSASQIRVHAYSHFSKVMADNGLIAVPPSPVTSPAGTQSYSSATHYPDPPAANNRPQPQQRCASKDEGDLLEVAEIISTLRGNKRDDSMSPRASDVDTHTHARDQAKPSDLKQHQEEQRPPTVQAAAADEGAAETEGDKQQGRKRRMEEQEVGDVHVEQKRNALPNAVIRQERQ